MPIHIRGATEHNLQGIDVTIGDGLTVVTGVSGSGKTSLAFDTLYHEARRRYLEIFSLGVAGERLAPAQVQEISGLGPAVGVGQNLLNRNPHSTLATASGLHPFLRYLYSRFGARHCAVCGAGVTVYSEDEVIDRISALVQHAPVTVAALMVINSRGSHQTLLRLLIDQFGPQAVHVDGLPWADLQPGAERPRLDPQQPHHIAVEVAHVDVGAQPTILRAAMQRAAALGASAVILKPHLSESSQLPERFDTDRVTLAVAPICTACGQ